VGGPPFSPWVFPHSYCRGVKGRPTTPSLFIKIGDPFLPKCEFNVKKRKVMKILKNDEGLNIVIDA